MSFKNFLQFVVIQEIKSFSVVNVAEVDVSLEFPCFLYDSTNVGNLISGSSAFSKPILFLAYQLIREDGNDAGYYMH